MRMIYDEKSPFTGNMSVLREWDEDANDHVKMCMETGYHTYEKNWKEGSDEVDNLETLFPSIVMNTKKTIDGVNWYKVVLMTPFLLLTPENVGGDIKWALYSLKPSNETSDEIVSVIQGDDGKEICMTVDDSTRKEFEEIEFSLAMDTFQAISTSIYGKIIEFSNEEE